MSKGSLARAPWGSLGTAAPHGAAGFTLVSAIFLMVVLVVLSVSLVSVGTVQHTTSAQMLQAVRANYATRAGLQWASWQAGNNAAGCVTGPAFALGGALSSFTVTVTCTRTDHPVGSAVQPYYLVDVIAESGPYGSPDYVRRQVQGKVLGP